MLIACRALSVDAGTRWLVYKTVFYCRSPYCCPIHASATAAGVAVPVRFASTRRPGRLLLRPHLLLRYYYYYYDVSTVWNVTSNTWLIENFRIKKKLFLYDDSSWLTRGVFHVEFRPSKTMRSSPFRVLPTTPSSSSAGSDDAVYWNVYDHRKITHRLDCTT